MALRVYKLRPEYEGDLVGGVIRTGADSEADIKDLLEQGGGEIPTDDPMLQSILDNYYGAHGLLLQAYAVDGEERTPINPALTATQQVPAVQAQPPTAQISPSQLSARASAEQGAVHDETESQYSTFTVDQLKETLGERNVSFGARASKQELVAALEENDRARQEG